MKIIIYMFIAFAWIETFSYIIMIGKTKRRKEYTKEEAVTSLLVSIIYTVLLILILNNLK